MSKKIVSIVLTIAMLAAFMCVGVVSAAAETVINPADSTELQAGDTVYVTCSANGTDDLGTFEFEVSYNTTYLTPVSYTYLEEGLGVANLAYTSTSVFANQVFVEGLDCTSSVDLITFTFTVNQACTVGDLGFVFNPQVVSVASTLELLDASHSSYYVTIDVADSSDTDTATDTDTSVDSDTDSAIDSDTDTSVDSDTDSSVDSDTDSAVDSDTTDTDVATDTDTAVDSDTDTTAAGDTETDTTADSDTDTASDSDSDTSTDTETGDTASSSSSSTSSTSSSSTTSSTTTSTVQTAGTIAVVALVLILMAAAGVVVYTKKKAEME